MGGLEGKFCSKCELVYTPLQVCVAAETLLAGHRSGL
jgi:hypothetical protein